MKAVDGRNNVKVYNLSAGKSLPDWLTDRKRRQLYKRDVDFRRKIELIQDFDMPDISNCIKATPDGQYILVTGTYKPRVKCFDVGALSLKFERCFDAEAVEFCILSEDYTKLAVLQEERYLEFHSKAGRWFRTRIPKFGRDLACHYPSADLYIAASGSEVYRLNLSQGRFLDSLQTDGPGVNKCLFNPIHYLFYCGMEDGRVEAWDPRSRHRVSVLDCAMHVCADYIPSSTFTSAKQLGITALATDGALNLAVGTQTGQILLYDIRSDKPMINKDHMDGFAIKDVEYHRISNKVISMSSKQVKIWEKDTGKAYTSIESDVEYNDLCVLPDSGMIFIATEDPKMQTYFLPSLGPAPRWCSHLDALVEELEEEDMPTQYDDYKFITPDELNQLGLDYLIGTNVLRAVMHGYYMDVRLYNKAKSVVNPFNYDEVKKRNIKQQIDEENQRTIKTKELPKVNRELYERLLEDETDVSNKPAVIASAKEQLSDERFKNMFKDTDFQIDAESDSFKRLNPVLNRIGKRKQQEMLRERQEEIDDLANKNTVTSDNSSDSDSIISSDESDLETKKPQNKKNIVKKVKITKHDAAQMEDVKKSKTNFVAADSLSELKANQKKLAKIPLAKRLEKEDNSVDTVKQRSFGSREMEYIVERAPKFERFRQQQKEHHLERKALRRSTGHIKGKIKPKNENF